MVKVGDIIKSNNTGVIYRVIQAPDWCLCCVVVDIPSHWHGSVVGDSLCLSHSNYKIISDSNTNPVGNYFFKLK